jgi:lipid-A-disaccharide synthase
MSGRADRVLIVAGEASADAHAAALVRELRALRPRVEVFGLGGVRLAAEGVRLLLDFSQVGVVGITEIVPALPAFYRAYRALMAEVRERPPHAAILLDLPDFNLFLAGRIRKVSPSTKIIYYISPQVWAWRRGRVKKIAARADAMLALFPFEEPIYRQAGMDVEFVGHPLADTVRPSAPPDELRREFGLPGDAPVVALLPGSRRSEIGLYLPVMVELMRALHVEMGARFFLALAPTIAEAEIGERLGDAAGLVRIVQGRTYDVLAAADAAVVKSGTSTLEAAIIGVPMVVLGAVSRLSYEIGVRLVTVKHFSLPNVIAGREVVPELIQHAIVKDRLLIEVRSLLQDRERATRMREDLRAVREALGPGGASARAAAAVAKRLWSGAGTQSAG